MTDRMTLDEAREKRLKAIKERLWIFYDLSDEQCSPELTADLALLDHLAARVEAGEAMANAATDVLAEAEKVHVGRPVVLALMELEHQLARWEGLSK